jgi:nifR3 family TIM-barrel protein
MRRGPWPCGRPLRLRGAAARDVLIPAGAWLAPMSGISTPALRGLCERLGASATVSEFVSAEALVHGRSGRSVHASAVTTGADHPRIVQLFGRDPQALQQAAARVVDEGAAVVDLNFGCPAKRVLAGFAGSALMREPELAQALVRAARRGVGDRVPVTAKIRAGWCAHSRNAAEFAARLVDAGVAAVTVHGRTRAQGFRGGSDPAVIAAVRAALPATVPVIANGDVADPAGAAQLRLATGADAVMIGRAGARDPWLFRRLRALEDGGDDPGPLSPRARIGLALEQLQLARALEPAPAALVAARRFACASVRDSAGAAQQRERLAGAADLTELARQLEVLLHAAAAGEPSGAGDPDHAAPHPAAWDPGDRLLSANAGAGALA